MTGQDVNPGMSDTKSHIVKNYAVWSPEDKIVGITTVVAILLGRQEQNSEEDLQLGLKG